jgi:hypothetical protein
LSFDIEAYDIKRLEIYQKMPLFAHARPLSSCAVVPSAAGLEDVIPEEAADNLVEPGVRDGQQAARQHPRSIGFLPRAMPDGKTSFRVSASGPAAGR